MRTATITRRGTYIRHLCSLGLESATIMPEIVAAAREIAGADFGHFIWAGVDFELKSVFSECPAAYGTLPAYDRLRRSVEVATLIGDFAEWMTLRRQFTNSWHVDAALSQSDFFEQVLAPCDGRHFIHILARQGGRGWGSMILVRARGGRPFPDAEHRAVEVFGEHLGHAIRRASFAPSSFADGLSSGILLVDWSGRIRHWSEVADRLVLQTTDSTRDHGRSSLTLPAVLLELVLRLRITSTGRPSGPAVKEITNRWGRFIWRAYPVEDEMGCVLHCQHQEPVEIQALSGAHMAGLGGQQQIVAAKLACGTSYKKIAAQLNVKESTIVDCVRQIYRRLDVHGSEALARRLRAEHLRARTHP